MSLEKVGAFKDANILFPIFVDTETREYISTHDDLGNSYISNVIMDTDDDIVDFDEENIRLQFSIYGCDGFIQTQKRTLCFNEDHLICTIYDNATFDVIAETPYDRDSVYENEQALLM